MGRRLVEPEHVDLTSSRAATAGPVGQEVDAGRVTGTLEGPLKASREVVVTPGSMTSQLGTPIRNP